MRKIFSLVLIFIAMTGWSQKINYPSEGKAVVYFVRSSSVGFLINFKYFDGDKYLGKFNDGNYLVYECEPGKHLFWAKSENVNFVEADLEAGKIYIIDAEAQMGALKAAVKLVPFNDDPLQFKNAKKYANKKEDIVDAIVGAKQYILSADEAEKSKVEMAEMATRAMEKYNKRKADGDVITVLTPSMYYRL